MTGPAMVNILAPSPKTNPSAAVNIGRSDLQKTFTTMLNCDIMYKNSQLEGDLLWD